jgi:hypothetical protein
MTPIKARSLEEALDKIGFDMGSTVEAVLTTLNSDGSVNSAPMGIIRKGPVQLEIRPYRSSKTYCNLNRNREACVNIINDPEIFLITAFKEEKLGPHPIIFDHDKSIKQADAVVFLTILGMEEIDEERPSFIGEASSVKLIKEVPIVFSRGRSQVIEAIIQATHIEYCLKNRKSADKYIGRFNRCKEIISRVSSQDSSEARIVKTLEKMINHWGSQK